MIWPGFVKEKGGENPPGENGEKKRKYFADY
jgi:hypothetical protein